MQLPRCFAKWNYREHWNGRGFNYLAKQAQMRDGMRLLHAGTQTHHSNLPQKIALYFNKSSTGNAHSGASLNQRAVFSAYLGIFHPSCRPSHASSWPCRLCWTFSSFFAFLRTGSACLLYTSIMTGHGFKSCIDGALFAAANLIDCGAHVVVDTTVSYTHLDVYKRQPQVSCFYSAAIGSGNAWWADSCSVQYIRRRLQVC